MFDSMRDSWEKLSDRERGLLGMTFGVFLLMVVFVAVYTTSSAVAEVEEERDEIRKILSEIELAGDKLERRMAERKAAEARFAAKMPALAAFVESRAKEQGLEVRQVLDEPVKEVNGYRRHGVRVSFQGVSLRPVMRMLASIAEERAPIAIDDLQIQHYQPGDTYKVDLGIVGFEPPKGKSGGAAADDKAKDDAQ